MMDSSDELMTVAEVARYLGVTPHTVYRWIAQGRLPATRYSPKVIRVRRSDLAAFAPVRTPAIAEPKVAYEANSRLSEAEVERDLRRVRQLLKKYRKMRDRPRSPDEPRPGSKEALLRHVGTISHEDAEELRRVIREAKTYSPPVEFR
jgi:excisionase family DNA binding protein